MQTKYELENGERLYKQGLIGWLKSSFRAVNCDVYLTSKRFVACKKPSYLLFGPFSLFMKFKTISFQINLKTIATITQESHALGKKITITTKTADTYSMKFSKEKDAWLQALTEAIKGADETVNIKKIGDTIEICR